MDNLTNNTHHNSEPICVKSEIGKLRKVLLHRPDKELEHLIPGDLQRLLFDDIPYLHEAQQEHDYFAQVLRDNGAEVVYLENLIAEVLRLDEGLKRQFITEFITEGDITDDLITRNLTSYFLDIPDELDLVMKMMAGVRSDELSVQTLGPLVRLLRAKGQFLLDPIPNLYFTRDPFACIGNGVSLHKMYSRTRCRETIFGKYIFQYHPDYAGKVPLYYDRSNPYAIEGGDVLNLSSKVICIGISQRTTPEAIELLASNIFNDETSDIEKIIALDIPDMRAFMHLDTVFTQVDYDKFTIHPAILRSLRFFEIVMGDDGNIAVTESKRRLRDVLAENLGVDKVTLISCGGKDSIASEREQWNDGSNTLCIEPGKVVVYDRNYVTNGILRDHGLHVIEVKSSELSRGRGGPRCMSMPFVRDEL